MEERGITLTELLESRDNRQALQKSLSCEHPGLAVMVLTVIMPGSVKRNQASLAVAAEGMKAIGEKFGAHVAHKMERDLPTGFEGWFLLDMPPLEAKRLACEIEDTHPLGRLMDIDVMAAPTQPMSRSEAGKQARKCLLCENEARLCMRMHSHTPEEIAAKINAMVADYVRGV